MNETQIEQALTGLGCYVDHSLREGRDCDWFICTCPFAKWLHPKGTDRKASFGITISDRSSYNCFTCGSKGTFSQLVKTLADYENKDYSDIEVFVNENNKETVSSILSRKRKESEELLVLSDAALIWPEWFKSEEASEYLLKERGISASVCNLFDLRYSDHNNRVIFPVRTRGLNGAVARSLDQKYYHNMFGMATAECLGGYDKLTDNKYIALVEGYFDLLKSYEAFRIRGVDVVCTFKAGISDTQYELIANTDKKVINFQDQDEAGHEGAKKIRSYFPFSSRVRWLDQQKDVGDFSESEVHSLLDKVFGALQ